MLYIVNKQIYINTAQCCLLYSNIQHTHAFANSTVNKMMRQHLSNVLQTIQCSALKAPKSWFESQSLYEHSIALKCVYCVYATGMHAYQPLHYCYTLNCKVASSNSSSSSRHPADVHEGKVKRCSPTTSSLL
jgi:hypothetical protein